jgi:hypothetical protein
MEDFEQKQLRDLYIREQIFNINDKAKNVSLNIEGIVKRRGTNYVVLEDNESNLHKSWIWDCIPISADKEVAVREHNLDVEYGFEAVSEKKYKQKFEEYKKDIVKKLEKESFEIGADYANHTKDVTPGETPEATPVDAKKRGYPTQPGLENTKISEKDVNKWGVWCWKNGKHQEGNLIFGSSSRFWKETRKEGIS